MALLKSLPNGKGIDATYSKIVQLNINYLFRQAHIDLAGFPTEELRRSEKDPIDQKAFDFNGDEFPFNENDVRPIRQVAYEAIKAVKTTKPEKQEDGTLTDIEIHGDFADATDC